MLTAKIFIFFRFLNTQRRTKKQRFSEKPALNESLSLSLRKNEKKKHPYLWIGTAHAEDCYKREGEIR